MVKYHKHAMVK